MVSLKKNQSGFTIVELLIVIVIIGILAGLVISTFVGVQQKGRNSERQTDINTISGQLEAYFAKNGGYPSNADLNNADWRTNNEIRVGDDDKALADPSSATTKSLADTAPAAVGEAYSYVTDPVTCNSPTNDANPPVSNAAPFCTGYTLTAFMEGNNVDPYVKKSSN